MSQDDSLSARDKMRLCPSCRMEISFFATKCRYCGETVGRPRDEARQLTITDLGGETHTHFEVANNVVEALEAFRKEELAAAQDVEEEHHSWFRRGHAPENPDADDDGGDGGGKTAAEMDEHSKDLASVGGFAATRRHASAAKSRQPDWVARAKTAALAWGVVVVVCLGGWYGKVKYDAYVARRDAIPVVHVDNRAIAILDSGGSALAALEAAMEALAIVDDTSNRAVADSARDSVRAEVEAMFNAENWNLDVLNAASRKAVRALEIDPNSKKLQALKRDALEEVYAYKIMLIEVNVAEQTARFRVTRLAAGSGTETEEVVYRKQEGPAQGGDQGGTAQGGRPLGRFEVKRLGKDWVRLADTKRLTATRAPRELRLTVRGRPVLAR